ncbi:hypothetical protein [Fusibacter sp. JL216-2]|uniref:hypothetical protein n=1 Tax=Fusibacter sp. JL216-2 TaxID=3071453 RepID=UPI003D330545
MMNYSKVLEDFRDLKINKGDVIGIGGTGIFNETETTVMICNSHVVNLLEHFISGEIDDIRALEWVNTVWFSDVFDYCEEGCDCIASVMSRLERIDEDFNLNPNTAEMLLNALEENIELN